MELRIALGTAATAVCLLALGAGSAQAVVTESGYITARDGTKLRYSMEHPDGKGPFPVLVNYEGYGAGSNPADNGVAAYEQRLLDRGYALVGVSVRGTGCSQGEFDPFAKSMGTDGYDSIEWAATQPWSDGRVGMIGVSFGGITQVLTAATDPPHLKAIAPSSSLSDLYRDVAYPGGILEYDFTFAWTALQKGSYLESPEPNAECTQNYVQHEVDNTNRRDLIPTLILDHPYFDDGKNKWAHRAPNSGFHNIQVPTFLFNAWQDEQLPGRIFESLGLFPHPNRVWANFTNGNHGRDYYSPTDQKLTLDFLDHFVRGVDNGFSGRVPHLTLAMETAIERGGETNEPAWNIERPSVNKLGARPRSLYLRSNGRLTDGEPAADEGSDSYAYPLPSSDVAEPGPVEGGRSLGQLTWKGSEPPAGSVAYTTAPLKRDLVVAGPASLDLWLSSTATDTDVQATITEVRPDGQETYVQRGWLRASHRKLDRGLSTPTRPYQTHLRDDAKPLEAGKPTKMRLEIIPFAHAFRKGSQLRVWIDAPTGHTGFWAFQPTPDPGQNTVLHDAQHPSRLVLGRLRGEKAEAPLPDCDTLRNQPCRPDPLAAG
jgi:putative CocE/NonD family hydrolase